MALFFKEPLHEPVLGLSISRPTYDGTVHQEIRHQWIVTSSPFLS